MSRNQPTVLIVDDSPEDRETYRRYLLQNPKYHYTILEAESGVEGLELCQRLKPDGILLDFIRRLVPLQTLMMFVFPTAFLPAFYQCQRPLLVYKVHRFVWLHKQCRPAN